MVNVNLTDREKEIVHTLITCKDRPCIFGVECPYDKYGYNNCRRHLMRDAADTIKRLSKSKGDE